MEEKKKAMKWKRKEKNKYTAHILIANTCVPFVFFTSLLYRLISSHTFTSNTNSTSESFSRNMEGSKLPYSAIVGIIVLSSDKVGLYITFVL